MPWLPRNDLHHIPIAGSHTVLALLEHGHRVTLIDNLSNTHAAVFGAMQRLAGARAGAMRFVQVRALAAARGCPMCAKAGACLPRCYCSYTNLSILFFAGRPAGSRRNRRPLCS